MAEIYDWKRQAKKNANFFFDTFPSLLNNQPHTQHFSLSEKTLTLDTPHRRQPAILTPYCYFNSILLLVSRQFGSNQLISPKPPFFKAIYWNRILAWIFSYKFAAKSFRARFCNNTFKRLLLFFLFLRTKWSKKEKKN